MKRLLIVLVLLAGQALAVEPDEILDDPALEARARQISQGLRCPVCRNESIDESNAELAADLRVLLRERLQEGDTDEEAVNYIVDRYGEYVLLQPNARGANLILWAAAPLALLIGLCVGLVAIRRRARATGPQRLTPEEEARLKELVGERSD